MADKVFPTMNAYHKRGISVTLGLLDEALCEIEQWANGREIQSVLYKERNALSSLQRKEILLEIARMRSLLHELNEDLALDPTVEDAGAAIRGKCSGLWENIVELKAKYLSRYGEVPADLEQYLDPRADQLIQGILRILDDLKLRTRNECECEPNQERGESK